MLTWCSARSGTPTVSIVCEGPTGLLRAGIRVQRKHKPLLCSHRVPHGPAKNNTKKSYGVLKAVMHRMAVARVSENGIETENEMALGLSLHSQEHAKRE